MKLCLGTVQFGMDYGIRGGRRPAAESAVALMEHAFEMGVDAVDTAAAYGEAECVVGRFLEKKREQRSRLFVVSKFGVNAMSRPLADVVRQSLERLRTGYLDAYICHTPETAGDPEVTAAMAGLKTTGLVRHIGYSVYETDEALKAIAAPGTDFIQVPYSVLDQRMARAGVFARAAECGVQVHVRSAFVQGLALMGEDEVPEWHSAARPLVRSFAAFSAECGIPRRTLALAFVKRQPEVSHIVLGVDDDAQLEENVISFSESVPDEILDAAVERFAFVDPMLVMPNKWRRS